MMGERCRAVGCVGEDDERVDDDDGRWSGETR